MISNKAEYSVKACTETYLTVLTIICQVVDGLGQVDERYCEHRRIVGAFLLKKRRRSVAGSHSNQNAPMGWLNTEREREGVACEHEWIIQ
jgi:hypothetical protein